MITVVLNAYKRQQYLKLQIESVLAQTVPIEKILLWNNGSALSLEPDEDRIVIANSSKNFGVWSRFSYALNAETEFVCVLDDDTFPREGFFETCLSQMKLEPALLGARGVRFLTASRYDPNLSFGWGTTNESPLVVDIVGHAWFFRRDWLSAFWRELPEQGTSRFFGEDIHFSYTLQKYLGIRTMVTPHPINNTAIWGNDPKIGSSLGTSVEAISVRSDATKNFNLVLQHYTRKGFRLCKDSPDISYNRIIVGPNVRELPILMRLINLHPYVRGGVKKFRKWLAKHGVFL
jgi:glycosyltransferase involved in cell wall biosynthesis